MPDASPTKWHLAHLTWFFETFVLEREEASFKPFDARFRVLFNSYYQGVGDRHPREQRGLITRPDLATVKRYRAEVDERMAAVIERAGAAGPAGQPLRELIELGLQHEQQHQELLLTDIKHALSFVTGSGEGPEGVGAYVPRRATAPRPAPPLRWLGQAGGLFEIGHDAARDGAFCFDNETPRHRIYTAPFELASRPVTHGEYLAFIEDGGYRDPRLWLSMGWDWVQQGTDGRSRTAPLYWIQRDGHWLAHTLQGCQPLDLQAPVCHLSYFEADAYARWAAARLPTEAEWEFAVRPLEPEALARGHFADRGAFHPQAAAASDEAGLQQCYGDVWEWTQSSHSAYPGYRPWPGAVGEYNGKFMCNQFVLRGGSCVTPAGHVRASYRNFFPPGAQWQFSGLRLARDATD